jgi:hypothetical protein
VANTDSRKRLPDFAALFCGLVLLTSAMPAMGMGLGSLHTRSYLGQPLRLEIDLILHGGETVDKDCFSFSAGDGGGLPIVNDAKIEIEGSGASAKLLVRTKAAVSEPILSIAVDASCPASLHREYAVLLDLPPLTAAGGTGAGPSTQTAAPPSTGLQLRPAYAVSNVDRRSARTSLPYSTSPAHTRAERPARKAKQAPIAQKTADKTAKPKQIPVPSKPMIEPPPSLTISHGGPEVSGNVPGRQLRLDTDLSRAGEAAPMNAADWSEEMVALNRRIAYLEAKLAGLEERRKSIESRRLQLKSSSSLATAEGHAQAPAMDWAWLLYLIAGLTAGGATTWVLLKRRTRKPASYLGTIFQPAAVPARREPSVEMLPEAFAIRDLPTPDDHPGEPDFRFGKSPVAEVDESIMGKAEVLLAHGQTDMALHLLDDYLREHAEESPAPWILALDLLNRSRRSSDFEKVREGFQQYFHLNIPEFDRWDHEGQGPGLESYPHILDDLVQRWQEPDCVATLDQLLMDKRDGMRHGFDHVTYRDLLLLRGIRAA